MNAFNVLHGRTSERDFIRRAVRFDDNPAAQTQPVTDNNPVLSFLSLEGDASSEDVRSFINGEVARLQVKEKDGALDIIANMVNVSRRRTGGLDAEARGALTKMAEALNTLLKNQEEVRRNKHIWSLPEAPAPAVAGDATSLHQQWLNNALLPESEKGYRRFIFTYPGNDGHLKACQELNDSLIITSYMLNSWRKANGLGPLSMKELKLWKAWEQETLRYKAMDTATTAEGLEFIPTLFSTQLSELVRLEARVHVLFSEIQMPSATFTIPIEGADPTVYLVGESTADAATKWTASTPGTKNKSLVAKTLGARALWSQELDEDSVIAMLPFLTRKFALAFAEALDEVIISGDDSGVHQDSDVTAATDRRKAWKGLRKLTQAGSKIAAGNIAPSGAGFLAKTRAARAAMKKYGVDPAKCQWIVGVNSFTDLMGLTASNVTNFVPLGTQPINGLALAVGTVGFIEGVPVTLSDKIREDVNASGVYDGVTTNRTHMLLVHKGSWGVGNRRDYAARVSDVLYMETGQFVIVASVRKAFSPLLDDTAEPIVADVQNIAKI